MYKGYRTPRFILKATMLQRYQHFFFSIFIYFVALVVAQPDLPPLLWNVESRSGIGIELQAPLSLGAWIFKHWTFGKDPTLLTFGVNVHMQVHVQRRLLNQYCSVLSFCSTVYVK